MLKTVIYKIIEECKNEIAKLEEEGYTLNKCIDYLDLTKMKNQFEQTIKDIEKEAQGEEKDND